MTISLSRRAALGGLLGVAASLTLPLQAPADPGPAPNSRLRKIPPPILVVIGTAMSADTADKIRAYMDEVRDKGRYHEVLILEPHTPDEPVHITIRRLRDEALEAIDRDFAEA